MPSDQPTEVQDVERRLTKLERRHRILKWRLTLQTVLLVLALIALGVFSQLPSLVQDQLRAEVVEIVDENGRSRIRLATTDENDAAIWFTDPFGRSRLVMSVSEEGNPSIHLLDSGGTTGAVLGMTEEEASHFTLFDPSQMRPYSDPPPEPLVRMAVTPGQGPYLFLTDGEGHPDIALGTTANGRTGAFIRDERGHYRALFAIDEDGVPELTMVDENAQERAALALSASGEANFGIRDDQGNVVIGMGQTRDGWPGLYIDGGDSEAQVGMMVLPTGPTFSMRDNRGTGRLFQGIDAYGQTVLRLEASDEARAIVLTIPADGGSRLGFIADGETLIDLGAGSDESVGLAITDVHHRPRILLTVDDQGRPALALLASNEIRSVELGLVEDEIPVLGLRDGRGLTRTVLMVDSDGTPIITLGDAMQQNRVSLGVSADGGALLLLSASGEQAAATLGTTSEGVASLLLRDGEDNTRVNLGVTGRGTAGLTVSGSRSENRVTVRVNASDEPAIIVEDHGETTELYGVSMSRPASQASEEATD